MKQTFRNLEQAFRNLEQAFRNLEQAVQSAQRLITETKRLMAEVAELWEEAQDLVIKAKDELAEPVGLQLTELAKKALADTPTTTADTPTTATLADEVEALEAEAPSTLAQVVASNKFYVLDTETTGLGVNDEIVEIAIIDQNGKIVINTRVNPAKARMSDVAERITGLTQHSLSDAPTFKTVYEVMRDRLDPDTPIIIYNAQFDTRMLAQSATANNINTTRLPNPIFCAMLAYSEHVGEWSNYHGNYKWWKLTEACEDFGINYENAHRALGDAQMTLALVKALCNHI